MNIIFSTIKWLLALLILCGIALFSFITFHPVFGGKPDETSLAKMQASPNFNGEIFMNLQETPIQTAEEEITVFEWGWKMLNPPKGKNPSEPLPTEKLDLSKFKNGSVAWLGHSTVLFQTNGKMLLTDPVFHRASPVPFTGQPFKMQHTPSLNELPALDIVLISHDHYDHLDYQTIRKIKDNAKHFVVPLGVKAHLQRWGVADEKISELDWDEKVHIDGVEIILVPSRHFSGRRLNSNFSTLWGGYVVKSPDLSLYYSADTGYGTHFLERVAKYAPFDFAMIENGAYNPRWSLIHEFPEQAIQALNDLNISKALPIHWGKFDLSEHQWTDSIERFLIGADIKNVDAATPKIGEVFNIFEPLPKGRWWEGVK